MEQVVLGFVVVVDNWGNDERFTKGFTFIESDLPDGYDLEYAIASEAVHVLVANTQPELESDGASAEDELESNSIENEPDSKKKKS